MGLWPTPGNEDQRRPREGGDPFVGPMDSRLRGNDVNFRGAGGDDESRMASGGAYVPTIFVGMYAPHQAQTCQRAARLRHPKE